MKIKLRLYTKLMLLIIGVVTVSISVIISFVTSWTTENIEEKAKTNIMNVANMVANSDEVIEALRKEDPDKKIGPYIDRYLKSLDQIEYIIVADTKEKRYSHPNPKRIGEKFVGGDDVRVLKNGESYISLASGTMGTALRAFVPIYDDAKREIGFVSVGTLTKSVDEAKKTAILYILGIAGGGLLIGAIGAFILSSNIKKTLMGLEPDEITKMYNEKMGIIDAIHEGLIAVDSHGKVTLINDSAWNIIDTKNYDTKEDVIGKDIEEVFITTNLKTVIDTGEPEFDREQKINNTVILTNRVPIKDREKIVGAIATFRDKTEIRRMAEELTGIKKMAWSLRAQNHEFMNKLHTISGLIQLEEYDEALNFISEIAKVRNDISNIVTKNIKEPSISAILLAKYNKAEESRIKLVLDKGSFLTKLPKSILAEDIVSILGNLIENSIDAVSTDGSGEIVIKLFQDDEKLVISVKDNGSGIASDDIEKIYIQGFSTKDGQRGDGMYIVKKIVDESDGKIELKVDNGVSWEIEIPM